MDSWSEHRDWRFNHFRGARERISIRLTRGDALKRDASFRTSKQKQHSFAPSPQRSDDLVLLKRTYRFHRSGHIIVPLSLFGQPGFLHQLLAVDHFFWLIFGCLLSGSARVFLGWEDEVTDIWNRNAVKSYANLALQLLPAVYLFLCADGAPSPLFPPSLFPHPSSALHTLPGLRHRSERWESVPMM